MTYGQDSTEMTVTVKIQFRYDEERTNLHDAMNIAEHLAVNPNFHTIEEGVELIRVQTCNQHI